jgi:hypothetical protein
MKAALCERTQERGPVHWQVLLGSCFVEETKS